MVEDKEIKLENIADYLIEIKPKFLKIIFTGLEGEDSSHTYTYHEFQYDGISAKEEIFTHFLDGNKSKEYLKRYFNKDDLYTVQLLQLKDINILRSQVKKLEDAGIKPVIYIRNVMKIEDQKLSNSKGLETIIGEIEKQLSPENQLTQVPK